MTAHVELEYTVPQVGHMHFVNMRSTPTFNEQVDFLQHDLLGQFFKTAQERLILA